MRIGSTLPRSFYNVPRPRSALVRERLRCVAIWETLLRQGMTTGAASQAVGVSRATLYRWRKRLETQGGRVGGAESEAPAGASVPHSAGYRGGSAASVERYAPCG